MIRLADTNVLVLADWGQAHLHPTCALAAIRYLRETQLYHRTGLDSRGEILKEYQKNVRKELQPGVGHAFLIHLYRNHSNPKHVRLVSITDHPVRGFEEFPKDPALETFDKSDRKFVAVAVALPSAEPHEIANAVDSDWSEAEAALLRNGIVVRQLCPAGA